MIPAFDARGNLPPGIHVATWDEIVDRYVTNTHRRMLLAGLLAALRSLRDAGCGTAYLDGATFLEYFQRQRATGDCKGIVAVELRTVP